MYKFLLFLLYSYLPVFTIAQTTIIVVRTSNGIFVGADTKRGITSYDPITNKIISQNSDTTCKIHKRYGFYYAIAGAKSELIMEGIEKSITPKKSFEHTLLAVIKNVSSGLTRYLKDLQRKHKTIFDNRFVELGSYEVALLGYENNIPKTTRIVFSVFTQPNQPVKIKGIIVDKNVTVSASPDEIISFPMGHAEEIKDLMVNREFWLSKQPSKAIEELIMIEAKAHPENVSAPVDILFITEKGFKWLQGPAKFSF